MQPQQQQGFRINFLGVIGGLVALVSIVLPWVTFFGIASENLISFIPDTLSSRPIDTVRTFGALFAIIFVIMGGFISFINPAGGIGSLLGGAVFMATVQNLLGVGPIIAVLGGILAVSGFFFPNLAQVPRYAAGPTGATSPPGTPAPPAPPVAKFCPTCGARYPEDYKVCPRDTTELKPLN